MSHIALAGGPVTGRVGPLGRYDAELDDIARDREMAARFNLATTATWLAELDQEERLLRTAHFQLHTHGRAA